MTTVRPALLGFTLIAIALTVPFVHGAGSDANATNNPTEKQTLTVDAIFGETPIAGSLPSTIRWLPESNGISYIDTDTTEGEESSLFVITSVPSGEKKIICLIDTLMLPPDLAEDEDAEFSFESYQWAETGEYIAFSYGGDIFTFDPVTVTTNRLTDTEEFEENFHMARDGKSISYTRDNDLYIIDVASKKEIRVTATACDTILNGVLDWVYMEELFSRGNTRAHWWSPDSRKLAFLEFNESPVPEYPLVDLSSLHGSVTMQRYPKAGDPNPIVRVGVYDLDSGQTRWMEINDEDFYIARVYWVGNSRHVAVETLNRAQTDLTLIFADAYSGEITPILTETDSAWVNITYEKYYHEDHPRFIWSSERSGFRHLYLYNLSGKRIRQITDGPWEVASLDGVDETDGWIYFTGLKTSHLERHLYRINEKGKKLEQLTEGEGSHYVIMSPDNHYYIDYYSTVTLPSEPVVCDKNGEKLFVLAERDGGMLDQFNLPDKEFSTFMSDDGITFYYSMIKPPGFDPAKKYPVIIYVYGGPHSQLVRRGWRGGTYLWHAMMAEKGYIIFTMDNRGTYGRGRAWENETARNLGTVELHDQLKGVDFLKSLPYVDGTRIGIWGWSYGGFMTCTALFRAPHVFKAGVSVAPLATWKYYDSIYTERYMKRPEDNEEGYERNNLLEYADSLEAPLLLVHGMADNNVHMQSTTEFITALVEAGKDFDLMLYPGKRHSIRGSKTRIHLFKKVTKFLEENL